MLEQGEICSYCYEMNAKIHWVWVRVVSWHLVSVRTFGVMYHHTFLNLQVTRSDIRPHIKWAVSLHMVTLIFLGGMCGYLWVNILTLSPPKVQEFIKTITNLYSNCSNIFGNHANGRVFIKELFFTQTNPSSWRNSSVNICRKINFWKLYI